MAVAQLGATALMTGLRAYLRRGLGLGEVHGQRIASKQEIYVVARKIKKCKYWNVITPSKISYSESIKQMRDNGELDGTLASSVILATCRLHELSKWKGPYHSAAETLVNAMKLALDFFTIKGERDDITEYAFIFKFRWYLLVEVQEEAEIDTDSEVRNTGKGKVQANTTPQLRRRFETIDFEFTRTTNSDDSHWPINWKINANEKAAIEAIISHWVLQNEFFEPLADCKSTGFRDSDGKVSVKTPAPLELGQLETIQSASRYRYWDMSVPEFFRWVPKAGDTFEREKEWPALHSRTYGLPIEVFNSTPFSEGRYIDTDRFFDDLRREKTNLDPMTLCSQLIFSQFVACLPVKEIQKTLGSDYRSNIPNMESNLQTGNTVRNPVLSDLAFQLQKLGLGSFEELLLSIVPPLKDCLPTQASTKIKDASGIREAIERISSLAGLETLDLDQIEYADKLLLWCLNAADSSARLYALRRMLKPDCGAESKKKTPTRLPTTTMRDGWEIGWKHSGFTHCFAAHLTICFRYFDRTLP